ncbi:MAG: hypothetical protein CPSOU_6569 [uncultured Paraburkholderia sp.]|nr:MAG: hypothetical protein CPSOU_6569 [uncultured Paraburkholderia sp.]
MSDPSASTEIEAVRDMVARFMHSEVVPVLEGYEKRGEFPRELVRKAGAAGLYGAVFPEAVGGSDMGYLAATVIQEEMARIDVRFAHCNNQQGSSCPSCIYFGGTSEQIGKYVPDLLAAETIGMMSLTEPGGGSDPDGNMKTFARRDGNVHRISGQKMFASMAAEIHHVLTRDPASLGVAQRVFAPMCAGAFQETPDPARVASILALQFSCVTRWF